jgi:hypothetical protein
MARKWSNQNSASDKPLKVDQEWWWPDDSEKLSKAMKELGWRTYEKKQIKSGGKPAFLTTRLLKLANDFQIERLSANRIQDGA